MIFWRWAGLALLIAGLWVGRREEALLPWLLLLSTKVIITLGFFGYAREGAVVIPVLALLLGLLTVRGLPRLAGLQGAPGPSPRVKRWLQLSCVLALLLVAVEGYRWYAAPVVVVDGRQVGASDPFPQPDYEDRQLRVK